MSRLSLAAATAFLLMNTAAYAGPIPFAFSGTVTAVGETINSAFVPGDSFTGIFMFDDQSIVDDVSFVVDVPNDPITSVNLIYESPVQFFFGTLGGKYSFVSQAAVETHHARSASGAIDSGSTIVTSSRENFQPPYPLVGPSVNGLPPASFGLAFSYDIADLVTGASPSFADPTGNVFYLSFNPDAVDMGGRGETLVGTVTSFERVPEPATASFFALGLAGAVVRRRRPR